jgi:hypothetical protein
MDVEVMTACVIIHNMIVEEERDDSVYDQGWIFRVSWLLQTQYRLLFRNFSIHIMRFETGQPTSPSMKILVNHILIHAGNNPITNPENNPV